jgi:hypothetical protein
LLFQSILQKSPHLTFLWYALFTFTCKNLDTLVIFLTVILYCRQHLPIHLRLEGFLQWDCRIQLTMEGKYYLDQQMDTFTL